MTEKYVLWYYLNKKNLANFIEINIPFISLRYINKYYCIDLFEEFYLSKIVFEKQINFIGQKYTEDNILIYEDIIISVALFIISNSYYFYW